jgi:hypothetical protein
VVAVVAVAMKYYLKILKVSLPGPVTWLAVGSEQREGALRRNRP